MTALKHGPRREFRDEAVDAILGDDIDFARYVIAIWRRVLLVVIAAVLAGALVVAGKLLGKPAYEASSTLAVTGSKIGEQSPAVVAANFRPLIENNSVAAVIVKEFGLSDPPYRLTPETFLDRVLTLEEVRNSNLMRVQVVLQDPSLAARLVNRVSDLAVEGARRLSQSEAVQARDDIRVELEQAEKQMRAASKRVEDFKTSAQLELTSEDVASMLTDRRQLPDLLLEIEAERAMLARIEIELASRTRIDTFTRSIDSDTALAEAARMNSGSASPVLNMQLKSEEINKVFEALEQSAVQSRSNLAALEKRREYLLDVRKLGAKQQSKLTELYRKQTELARLETDFAVAEASYKEIAARYDVARLQVAGRSAQLQVIDRAIVPSHPRPLHLIRDSLIAVLAGATLMAIAIVLMQALQDVLSRAGRT